ncbi:Protein of unknown function [Cotesia congregata]|uniref:Uncharacterized protein n=1 Tax=Cotesia congregata TaxID=51543 RepID=A0A8J2MNI9_COTCN|nr:Protein of unknown function [Cotesia congregata]
MIKGRNTITRVCNGLLMKNFRKILGKKIFFINFSKAKFFSQLAENVVEHGENKTAMITALYKY